jgi:Holliday junction resolvase RusA-like endonuclease
MSSFEVTIPCHPSVLLKPGAQSHWTAKARAKKEDTEMGYMRALVAKGLAEPRPTLPLGAVDLWVTFMCAQQRHRDPDNWHGRLKGFLDGIVRAGIIEDDNSEVLRSVTIEFIIDKQRAPATVLRFTEVA